MKIYKVMYAWVLVAIISCSVLKSAVEPGLRTRFIVYSYSGRTYEPVVREVAAALQLPIPEGADIVYVEHQDQFERAITDSRNTNWVCIAHYDKCRPVAELTRGLHETQRSDINFHSILFFDSDPIERAGAGAITERIVNTVSSNPLDIKFEKILHRIYNFYSESTSAWFRKIYPADKYVREGLLPIARWGGQPKPYLKGVNIKCFAVTQAGTLEAFKFSQKLGILPLISNYGPSDALARAARNIGTIIRIVDANYLINTDLVSVLENSFLAPVSDVIPDKNADPLVIINRPTYWDGVNLSQIIASEGTLSWLTWGTVGKKTEWIFQVNAQQRADMYSQIADESNVNAQQNMHRPYFAPWLHDYRRRIFGFKAVPYTWFNTEARVANAAHKSEIAYATVSKPGIRRHMSTAEREFIEKRGPAVRRALAALGLPGNKFPKIAVVASGGGIRAMLTTLGVLRGLEQTRLLDVVTYACGLSGSTWAIAPWISSNLSVNDYITRHNIVDKVQRFDGTRGAFINAVKQKFTVTDDNMVKTVFGQPWTFVDSWGLYISKNMLINPEMTLSQQERLVADGTKPLPIYTAVTTDARSRDWFEFTPFEIGSINRNVYIPSWSFGRYFISGVSQDFAPEQSLGYLLGIFGSAMGARFRDVAAGAGLGNLTAAEWSATSGIVPNFFFGLKDVPGNTTDMLELVDAGADFNLPYPPISGLNPDRKADIIIFVDASGEFGQDIGGEIRKLVQWQKQIGVDIKLPDNLDFLSRLTQGQMPKMREQRIRVFPGDGRNGVPTVIYIPMALDFEAAEGFPFSDEQRRLIDNFRREHGDLLRTYTNENLMSQYLTSTFSYPKAQSNFLLDLMTLNVQISTQKIRDGIQRHLESMP
jgi:phospholipase A2